MFIAPGDHVADEQSDVEFDPACVAMMEDFIAESPGLWNEDIGE